MTLPPAQVEATVPGVGGPLQTKRTVPPSPRGTQKRNCPHTDKPNHGRGLCRACYLRMSKDGTLADVASNGRGRPKGFKPPGESPMIWVGEMPKVRMRLTELDVLGQSGKAGMPKGW